MKKLFKWAMPLAATSIILAACGSDDTTTGDGGEITKLTAGAEATFAPFEYLDDKGNIVGIDAEILKGISEATGVEIEFKNVGWDTMFEQLRSNGLDIGASGITITDDRKAEYDFTEPYFEATQLIVVKEDSTVASLEDLEGKKISVQINTTGQIGRAHV